MLRYGVQCIPVVFRVVLRLYYTLGCPYIFKNRSKFDLLSACSGLLFKPPLISPFRHSPRGRQGLHHCLLLLRCPENNRLHSLRCMLHCSWTRCPNPVRQPSRHVTFERECVRRVEEVMTPMASLAWKYLQFFSSCAWVFTVYHL